MTWHHLSAVGTSHALLLEKISVLRNEPRRAKALSGLSETPGTWSLVWEAAVQNAPTPSAVNAQRFPGGVASSGPSGTVKAGITSSVRVFLHAFVYPHVCRISSPPPVCPKSPLKSGRLEIRQRDRRHQPCPGADGGTGARHKGWCRMLPGRRGDGRTRGDGKATCRWTRVVLIREGMERMGRGLKEGQRGGVAFSSSNVSSKTFLTLGLGNCQCSAGNNLQNEVQVPRHCIPLRPPSTFLE